MYPGAPHLLSPLRTRSLRSGPQSDFTSRRQGLNPRGLLPQGPSHRARPARSCRPRHPPNPAQEAHLLKQLTDIWPAWTQMTTKCSNLSSLSHLAPCPSPTAPLARPQPAQPCHSLLRSRVPVTNQPPLNKLSSSPSPLHPSRISPPSELALTFPRAPSQHSLCLTNPAHRASLSRALRSHATMPHPPLLPLTPATPAFSPHSQPATHPCITPAKLSHPCLTTSRPRTRSETRTCLLAFFLLPCSAKPTNPSRTARSLSKTSLHLPSPLVELVWTHS